MAKVTTTHLVLNKMNSIHVVGTREVIISALNHAKYYAGEDFIIAVKNNQADLSYYKTNLWIGSALLAEAMVVDEHELEIGEAPPSDGSVFVGEAPKKAAPEGLVVEL